MKVDIPRYYMHITDITSVFIGVLEGSLVFHSVVNPSSWRKGLKPPPQARSKKAKTYHRGVFGVAMCGVRCAFGVKLECAGGVT